MWCAAMNLGLLKTSILDILERNKIVQSYIPRDSVDSEDKNIEEIIVLKKESEILGKRRGE
jgi:hypothetical protein